MEATARDKEASKESTSNLDILPANGPFPVLRQLLGGPMGDAARIELQTWLTSQTRPAATRAPRLRKNLFAKLRPTNSEQCEVGVVCDISLTGVRVKFLRSSSLDIIRNECVELQTRLPSTEMVTLQARMVRVASSTQLHIELAFHFADEMANNEGLLALLQALTEA